MTRISNLGGVSRLTNLFDVNLTSPINGDLLQYSSATSQWVNATLSSIADSRYVLKSGDTMTGALTNTLATGNSLVWDTNTLIVDATNHRVGIGVTSPQAKLDINGGILFGNGSTISAPVNGSALTALRLGVAVDVPFSNVGSQVILSNVSNNHILLGTNNTERIRIFNTGGVSIGDTTDPGIGQLRILNGLTVVAGGSSISGINSSNLAVLVTPGNITSNSEIGAWANNSFTQTITGTVSISRQYQFSGITFTAGSSQNVTTASTLNILSLPVTAGSATMTNSVGIDIATTAVAGGGAVTTASALRIAAPTGAGTNYAINVTSGTSYFNGNVGIGTTTVTYKLTLVTPDAAGTGLVLRNNADTGNIVELGGIGTGGTVGRMTLKNAAGTATTIIDGTNDNYIGIAGNKKLGIGTATPGYTVDAIGNVTGVGSFQNTVAGSYANLFVQSNDTYGLVESNSSTRAGSTVGVNLASSMIVQASYGDLILMSGPGNGKQTNFYLQAANSAGTQVQVMAVMGSSFVGIGTIAPLSSLSIGSPPAALLGVETVGIYQDAANSFTLSRASTDASGASMDFWKSRGTHASPTTIVNGDNIMGIAGHVYTNNWKTNVVAIAFNSDGTVSSTSAPTKIVFYTTPTASVTQAEVMRIDNAGNVGIGVTPTDNLEVRSTTGANFTIGRVSNVAATSVPGTINFKAPNASSHSRVWASISSIVDTATEGSEASSISFNTQIAGGAVEIARMVGSSLGIGVTVPTAILHIKAGTATASTAPLKFNSGTNLTTPEAGAVEFDGSFYYLSI